METRKQQALHKTLAVLSIFLAGFFASFVFSLSLSQNIEHPLSFFSISEVKAPADSIPESNIEVYSDRIIIKLDNASLSEYASTGSMLPLFDKGANGIRIVPKSESEIEVGDIITFERGSILVVHRVIEKGKDNLGAYFITKGDNNFYSDGKVRFSDVKYLTIGILY
ncbi:MAG TPA: hypothetical protein VI544_01670 [Candidatus Nanoarchaeia archaeon]|nr:hypothetical protein [Candidatus Nanoarchaeia archaeon]